MERHTFSFFSPLRALPIVFTILEEFYYTEAFMAFRMWICQYCFSSLFFKAILFTLVTLFDCPGAASVAILPSLPVEQQANPFTMIMMN